MIDKIKNIRPEQVLLWIGVALCALAFYLGSSWRADYQMALAEYESEEAVQAVTETVASETEAESGETELESESSDSDDTVTESTSLVPDAETVSEAYTAALETAVYVADLQTEYIEDIYTYGNVAGQEEVMLVRIQEIQAELAELFNDSSFINLWFQPQDADSVAWEAYAALDYSGETIPVIWICMTDSDMAAAYVTADYDMESGMFYNPVSYISSVGAGLSAYTESDETEATAGQKTVEESVEDVLSLIEQSQELGLTDETETESSETETESSETEAETIPESEADAQTEAVAESGGSGDNITVIQ